MTAVELLAVAGGGFLAVKFCRWIFMELAEMAFEIRTLILERKHKEDQRFR